MTIYASLGKNASDIGLPVKSKDIDLAGRMPIPLTCGILGTARGVNAGVGHRCGKVFQERLIFRDSLSIFKENTLQIFHVYDKLKTVVMIKK